MMNKYLLSPSPSPLPLRQNFLSPLPLLLSLLLLMLLLVPTNPAMAQTTGKMSGRVVDATNGDPLPGVNIIIEGTLKGVPSDIDGYFNLLQIQPGTYSLRFSMVGYTTVIVREVVVRTGLTTTIDAKLAEQLTEMGEEIIVTAVRPIIQKDITASLQYVDAVKLMALPVADAREGLLVQAGLFLDPIPVAGGLGSAGRGEQRYSVRGGGQDEVKWFIDGVRTATLVAGRADWGGSFTNINMDIIKEVQLMTGGFTAEFGEAQSGIVNVVTREGGDAFSGNFNYLYGLPGQRHFGNYLYDPKTQKEFLDHTLPDGSLDPAWWTPFRQAQVYDYTKIPDHTLNASLGGPLGSIAGRTVNFFAATQLRQQAYALPRPRDARNSENVFANLTTRGSGWNLRLNAMYNRDAHSTLQENGDFTSQAKFYRGWGSLINTSTYTTGLHYTKVLNPSLFYEGKLSYYRVEYRELPSDFTELGKSAIPTLFGFQRFNGFEDEPFDQFTPVRKSSIGTGDLSLTGGLHWQVDRNNLIRTGFEIRRNTYAERYDYRLTSYSTDERLWLNRGLHETFNPWQIAFYLQDKMEFDSMILNVGVRYDYFNPNRDWFVTNNLFNNAINPDYNAASDPQNTQIDANGNRKYSFENAINKPRERYRDFHMISPRFGVSFPMSVNTLLHFNYGHFYQMPALDQMFEFNYFRPVYIVDRMNEGLNAIGTIPHIPSNDGDPERLAAFTREPLKPQKTIMFEVGFKQNLGDLAVLDVVAYYKDVFDQTEERVGLFDRGIRGYDPFRDRINPNQAYSSFFSGDYGDSRGFEINFQTLFSQYFRVDANYSFSRSTAGRASPRNVILNTDGTYTYEWDTQVNKRIPVERSFSRPHIMRVNMNVNGGKKGVFRDFSSSIFYRFVSGQSFTYLQITDPADTYNNYRYPASHNVDWRLERSLSFGPSSASMYVLISNVLNTKNLRSYGDVLFDADATRRFVEDGFVSPLDAGGYDLSWQNYFEPRRFQIGVRYGF